MIANGPRYVWLVAGCEDVEAAPVGLIVAIVAFLNRRIAIVNTEIRR
jgi:hypothetical protein